MLWINEQQLHSMSGCKRKKRPRRSMAPQPFSHQPARLRFASGRRQKARPFFVSCEQSFRIFEKTRFSAASPEVMAILKEKQIENIILIGAEAHICMLQTTLDLLKHNIRVHIPYECTTSRNPLNKDNVLQQMLTAGAAVSNVESLLFNLMGDAKHPAFKTISKLIQ